MSEEITNLNNSVHDLTDAFRSKDKEQVNEILNDIVKSAEELKRINEKIIEEQQEKHKENKVMRKQDKFRKIRIVSKRKLRKLRRISKNKLNYFKQRLKMLASTKSFQSVLLNAKESGLVAENKVLEKVADAKDFIKDKTDLVKKIIVVQKDLTKTTIQTKVGTAKKIIVNTSKEGVKKLKDKARDIKLTTTTYVGASALYAKDAVIDKKEQAKEKISDAKEALVDKALLVNYRIRTKLASKKNIIVRKTGMEIALFKKDVKSFLKRTKENIQNKYDQAREAISNKYNKMFNMDDETLNRKRQEIEILKQQRAQLASQILHGNDSLEFESMGRSR